LKRRLEHLLSVAAAAAVIWFFHWTIAANNGFASWDHLDYFRLLVRGWQKGQLHLDYTPAPELLALPDPYDPAQNEGLKLGDATLYRGRYYLYFGAAPAFTLMLPYALVTGRELTMGTAVFVFVSLAFLTASGLWLAIRRRYFPESAAWMAPVGMLLLGCGTHLLALAQRPMIWELPIAGGVFFSLLAVAACFRAVHGRRPVLAMAAAGLCLGLAVGSRPTCLFAAPLLLGPLWLAWRERRPERDWRGMVAAAIVPLGLCGLALMWHNHARFDSPFEFGQNYQLSGAHEGQQTHFSLRYFAHNFSVYFFHALNWTAEFPFAMAYGVDVPDIPGYFGTEEVSGLVATFPYVAFILALPLAWWRRDPAEARTLTAAVGSAAGYALPVTGLILCFFSTCARYQTDFAVGLGLLALTGMLALERRVRSVRLGWIHAPVFAGVAAVTLVLGVLLSFDYHGRTLRMSSPAMWQRLDRMTFETLAGIGHRCGAIKGPRVIKAVFNPRPTGTVETFWRSRDTGAAERVLVEHIGEQLIRFGFTRGAQPVQWGRPLKWEPGHAHAVEIQVPSLYAPEGTSGWSRITGRFAFRERTAVAVWFSAGRALGLVVEPLANPFQPGGTIGEDFSGEVRSHGSRLFRADEITTGGLVAPEKKRGGVLSFRLVLPATLQPAGEPLYASGAHYRSSIVFVRAVPGGVKFVYENFGGETVESELVQPKPGGFQVELILPNFRPEAFGEEHTGDVILRLDGREVLRTRQVAYPSPWGDESYGRNPFGTTCAAELRGWMLDARWSAADE
jgi:hypothetical protein